MKLTDKLSEVSRRSFLKGMAAMGATATIAGCSKNDGETYVIGVGGDQSGGDNDLTDLTSFDRYFITCPHNCGPSTRCVSQAWVKDGVVKRVTSDDFEAGGDGVIYNKDAYNDPRKLSCAKGRAYKFRAYHNGRLKYPMKQTKKRGDLTGFVRISWEEAYDEVMRKYWAIYSKYGPAAIQLNGGAGSAGTGSAVGGATNPIVTNGGTRSGYSDHSFHQYNYGSAIAGVPGSAQYNSAGLGTQLANVYGTATSAGDIKHWVSFGTNSMTTNNTMSYIYLRANQKARADHGDDFKHYVISPELTDTGVLCATDWVQIRNQTDPALIAGMIYHLITETFDTDGSIKPNPLLDVDYIDTVLYGFFDSPEYWVKTGSANGYYSGTDTDRGTSGANPYAADPLGTIYLNEWKEEILDLWIKTGAGGDANPIGTVVKTLPADDTDYTFQAKRWQNVATPAVYAYTEPLRRISEVPAGQSYAAWIMGSDPRLTLAMYDDSINTKGHSYTAKRYVSDGVPKARAALCSLSVNGQPAHSANMSGTSYYTKKDYMTPKDPNWAEKITGVPAATIRELAELYARPENHPILTEWTGGLQKSENGVITLFAIQTLFALTKNWGWNVGSTGAMYQTWNSGLPGNMGTPTSGPTMPSLPAVPTTGTNISPNTNREGSANPSTPAMSVAEHHQGLYFAFKKILDEKGFKGEANPEWDGETRYMFNAAGAKSQVLFKRDPSNGTSYVPKVMTLSDGSTRTYNDWVTDDNGEPIYSGKRMYIGGAGVMMNGIANPNWAKEIFQKLPLAGWPEEGSGETVDQVVEKADTFCLAAFDFHLTTHVMFADYVFPLANTMEGYDGSGVGGRSFVRPALITPPGEALDTWDSAYVGWKQRTKTVGDKEFKRIDGGAPFTIKTPANTPLIAIGETNGGYISHTDKFKKSIAAASSLATSPLYGKTFEQAIQAQIRPMNQQALVTPTAASISTQLRQNLDSYLANTLAGAPLETAPFVTFATNRTFTPRLGNSSTVVICGFTARAQAEIPATNIAGASSSNNVDSTLGRMTCYAEYAVKIYERQYDIYQGWLPEDKRAQANKDYEGDPFIYPIPLYYDFRDSFNEAYGVFNPNPARRNYNEGWKLIGPKPATNDVSLITDRLTVTVGSTHDRFRSHSSTAENPLTRELNCRTKGGGWASGNDWNEYGVIPEDSEVPVGENVGMIPMRSKAIQNRNMETASWHEFWMNDEDAAQFDIKDGDLIRISNPIGAIRCTARVTARIVRGHGQIHHGAWYDPNPEDGVDDGACANTLMSNRPSKLDYGNSVHCAYCVIEKENSY